MPVNPRSSGQSSNRSVFQDLASRWRTLTDAQRGGWKALGAQMTKSNSLGVTVDLTGLQAYMSVNRTLGVMGSAFVDDAPTYSQPISLLTVTPTATA